MTPAPRDPNKPPSLWPSLIVTALVIAGLCWYACQPPAPEPKPRNGAEINLKRG